MFAPKCVKFSSIFLSITLVFIFSVNLSTSIPIDPGSPNVNPVSPNYIEIKLPVKITSMEDLISWIKNAMKSMASRIDITLASDNESTSSREENLKLHKLPNSSDDKSDKKLSLNSKSVNYSAINTLLDKKNSWLANGNELFSSSVNREAYLPLFIGDLGKHHEQENGLIPYTFSLDHKDTIGSAITKLTKANKRDKNDMSDLKLSEINHTKLKKKDALNGFEKGSQVDSVPFAIPFEAFITITKESQSDPHSQALKTNLAFKQQSLLSTTSPLFLENKKSTPSSSSNVTSTKLQGIQNTTKKNKSRASQTAVLNRLVKMVARQFLARERNYQDAKTSAAAVRSRVKNRQGTNRPPFSFEDVFLRATRNESQRQEFDDDEDEVDNGNNGNGGNVNVNVNVKDEVTSVEADDDEDYEDNQGSLGSIANLLPLALPVLEDLSDPESDVDLIGLLQAGIPLVQGLSEPDEDGNGGAQELIDMIVPIVKKIVGGQDGQGSDIGAIVGPLFGILAPFIGPVFAPVVGPLIRTISNPPTEGSSLPALVNAIAGPLSQPQQPSGMSPLSIVIAGTTAALLKELQPGAPGGSDLGAFVAAILSGVITGASAGFSGGSSESQEPTSEPYSYDPPQASTTTSNANYNSQPTLQRPLSFNNPYPIRRPNNIGTTVNIGSTLPPSTAPVSVSPVNHKYYNRPTPTSYQPHSQSYVNGPVPAAATSGNGGSSYLPYGSTTVPAHSINPLSLIGNSVQDVIGAGLQVVSSLINAVFGILGASSGSSDPPAPSYGPPSGPYSSHTSG